MLNKNQSHIHSHIADLKRSHTHFTWWIHEVKVYQIVDAQLLQLQHDCPQVGAKNLGIRVVLHLVLVSLLGVETEALSWLRPPGSTGPLLSTGLGDGRH